MESQKEKIAILMAIARQVEGEWVQISIIKASKNLVTLKEYLSQNELPRTKTIENVNYVIEYGIIEDVEITQG